MTKHAHVPHSRPTPVPGMEEAVLAVLRSGQHAGRSVRTEFERAFAARLGVPSAFAVQSGFAALHLALLALGVERGRPVVAPSYVCAALLHAIDAAGARPVLADVDERELNLTPATVRAALAREGLAEREVAAVIVPHNFGYPAPLHRWDLAIPVIEDCAMALGASLGGREVGGHGRVSVFSFYATKMLSTGQGGMVATSDGRIAAELRDRLEYDNRERWRPAFNYLLSDLGASLGAAQMPHLDDFVARRRAHADHYREAAAEWPVELQVAHADAEPCFFRFVIITTDAAARAHLIARLAAAGVEAKPPVFRPLHRYLGLPAAHFPVSEKLAERALSIPIYPSLEAADRARVIEALNQAFAHTIHS